MKIVFLGANNPETLRDISAQQKAASGLEVVGFLDNDEIKIGTEFRGYKVLGKMRDAASLVDLETVGFLNLITRDCPTRLETSLEIAALGGKFVNLIHPGVDSEFAEIGTGVYIQEGAILQAECAIGNNSAINSGCVISHETRLGNTVFMAPGGTLAGCVTVEDGVFIGVGATVMPRLTIGKWSVIGAGSVVTKDVAPYSVVAGSPARVIRTIDTALDSGDII